MPTPTTTELQAAWETMRRPDWPPLEQLAAYARYYSLVQGQALRMARGLHARTPAPQAQPQASRSAAPPLPLPRTPPSFDGKRAACGERDDE